MPMNPRTSIRGSNCWKTKCRPRKPLLPFELELNGKMRQLPGKNFVKSFSLSRFEESGIRAPRNTSS
jgi:hypothetical protein